MSYCPGVSLEQIEREAIIGALRFHGFNRSQAARDLGIAIRTMRNKVARYVKEGHLNIDLEKEELEISKPDKRDE